MSDREVTIRVTVRGYEAKRIEDMLRTNEKRRNLIASLNRMAKNSTSDGTLEIDGENDN